MTKIYLLIFSLLFSLESSAQYNQSPLVPDIKPFLDSMEKAKSRRANREFRELQEEQLRLENRRRRLELENLKLSNERLKRSLEKPKPIAEEP